MKARPLVKTILSCSLLGLVSQTTLASNNSQVVCPGTEQLKQFHLTYAYPYDFNLQSQRVKFEVEAEQEDKGDGYANGSWFLSSISLQAGQSEDIRTVLNATLEKLTPVSPTPFQYEVIDDDDYKGQLPVCVYTIPGNETVSVMATFLEGYDDDEDGEDYPAKKRMVASKHHQRLMKITKHMSLK